MGSSTKMKGGSDPVPLGLSLMDFVHGVSLRDYLTLSGVSGSKCD